MTEKKYLLMKRGVYYAPDNQGYTGLKRQAGLYHETDAQPDEGVTAIHICEAPDYAPNCYADYKCIEAERISVLDRLHKFAVRAKTPMEIVKEIERLRVSPEHFVSPL
jgi:hypothetical protein